jgi:uncharacterized membrane protein YbhN (UPF0104 family)
VRSLEHFWDAVQAFVDRLGSVGWQAMILAIAFHVANLLLRSRAWQSILADALPRERVRWSRVFGAYTAGVGINAIVPARAGDVTKLFLVHQKLPRASYPTLGATLIVETLFDIPAAFVLILWAWLSGHVPHLPGVPAFEFSFIAEHATIALVVAVVLAFAAFATFVIKRRQLHRFWARVADGFNILREPRRYLRRVAALQAAGWICRIATAWFFLEAFHIPATLENALLVLVIQSAATALPLTPGGIGPKQALAVVLLAGTAAKTNLLAFSIGMEVAIVATNVILGFTSMALMLRGVGFREAIRAGRRHHAEPPTHAS